MVLTAQDLSAFKELINSVFDEKFEEKFTQKLSLFPTKEDYFSRMDTISTELKTIRQEQTIYIHKMLEHDRQMRELQEDVQSLKQKSKKT